MPEPELFFPEPLQSASTGSRAEITIGKQTLRYLSPPLKPASSLPNYSVWLPLRRNIPVEDEHIMTHVPYVGDDDPESFLDAYVSSFAINFDDLESGMCSPQAVLV
jgi:hypothetical protein